jgi:hypothetical protein
LSGDWSADGDAIQQRSNTQTDLVLDTGLTAEQYRIDVTVDLSGAANAPDSGGGVLLGLSGKDTRIGAYLVRLGNNGRSALWGYFAGDGSFVSLGGAQLDKPTASPQILSVMVNANSFDITVGGRAVAARVPFRRQGAGIGLVSFGGPVNFTGFRLREGASP